MHIIIIGCGKVGSAFAKTLSEEGHDVVIVDNDNSAFKLLDEDFNGITITGVPIDQEVLKSAGIESADVLAAVTPDDNVNIMVSQVAKEIFKVPKVLARIHNPSREHVFHQFGLETICPTNITADTMRTMILDKSGVSSHTIGNMVFSFRHEEVTQDYVGKKLGSIKPKDNMGVFGVIRNRKFMFFNPSIKLNKGDVIILAQQVD